MACLLARSVTRLGSLLPFGQPLGTNWESFRGTRASLWTSVEERIYKVAAVAQSVNIFGIFWAIFEMVTLLLGYL